MKTIVLNPFSIDSDSHSNIGAIECLDPSLTVQADVAQADINNIVKQFGITHQLPYGMSVPEFADYSDVPNDFHAAMNFIRDTDQVFMSMPAEHRARFENDPGQFLDFVNNPDNYDEAVKLGFVVDTRPAAPAADDVPAAGKPDETSEAR